MKKVHVYAHTHWDYEWYFSANESIIQLIYHMDEVIDALQKGILTTYLLDSQVSILEEYLIYMPEKTEVVKDLVNKGSLMIGPWYTQSDELILSGESVVRNLWYGMQYANALGKCMNIGYLPDSFGQSQDMPKLYQGYGIPSALFWRGLANDVCNQRAFIWKSKDGSEVLAYNIRDGYFYGGNLIYNDDVHEVEQPMLQNANTIHQLLPVGGDQRYVDYNLKERIAYYNMHTTQNMEYYESDLEQFYSQLRKEGNFTVVEGEFIDASVSKIHRSIYSSRYDHKVLNDQIERRIQYQLEPFMVMQQRIGILPKRSVLDNLWKKLLLNHAHDSACGCNSDKTNASILQRLKDCDEMSAMLLDYQVRKVSESIQGVQKNDVLVYNTLPYTRLIQQELQIHTKKKGFLLFDEEKKELEYDIISSRKEYSGSIRKDTSGYDEDLFYYTHTIRICMEMEPLSMCILHIQEKDEELLCVHSQATHIENSMYRIHVEDGKLCLLNKQTQEYIEDFLYIQDSGDDGDTYDYSYPTQDVTYNLHFKEAQLTFQIGKTYQNITCKGTWALPYKLEDRKAKMKHIETAYTLSIYLDQTNLIACKLQLHNRSIQHRMRVIVKHTIVSSTSIADTLFGTIERENKPKHMHDWQEIGYKEEPTPIYPMLHHVSVKDTACCVVYTKGIKEYEVVQEGIALTLFRSVNYLGKPDLARRPGKASGNEFKYIETPDSTLRKQMDFAFAISYQDTYDAFHIQKSWIYYANDALYYQIQDIHRFVNTQKYFVTHPYQKKLPKMQSFLSLDALEHVVFSSLIPIDDTKYAVRVFNTRWSKTGMEVIYSEQAKSVEETNLLLESKNIIDISEGRIEGYFQPEEIKTYKISIK